MNYEQICVIFHVHCELFGTCWKCPVWRFGFCWAWVGCLCTLPWHWCGWDLAAPFLQGLLPFPLWWFLGIPFWIWVVFWGVLTFHCIFWQDRSVPKCSFVWKDQIKQISSRCCRSKSYKFCKQSRRGWRWGHKQLTGKFPSRRNFCLLESLNSSEPWRSESAWEWVWLLPCYEQSFQM